MANDDVLAPEEMITRERLAGLLNEDLAREYQAIIAYIVYSQVLKGAEYMNIATELETHALEELQHALIVSRQIDYLGQMPTVTPLPVRTSDDPRAMLQHALDQNQFLLLAQKVVALKPGTPDPVCYEVLLRLKQEEDNLLPPGGFLDLADSFGMMDKIDQWVVRALLAWCAARVKRSPAAPLPMMCVNVSAAAVTSAAFAKTVLDRLERAHLMRRDP